MRTQSKHVVPMDPWAERLCPCGTLFRPSANSGPAKAAEQRMCSRECAGEYRSAKAQRNIREANRMMRVRRAADFRCRCQSCIDGRAAAAARLAKLGAKKRLTAAQISARAERIRAGKREARLVLPWE